MPSLIADSYEHCRRLTRASGSSFFRGMMLTPRPKRGSMFALYAWMRAADDAADGGGQGASLPRLAALAALTRHVLGGGATPESEGPSIYPALRDTVERYGIEPRCFEEMLAGQAEDLGPRRVADYAELERYCHRVAATVGHACVAVWGDDGDPAVAELVAKRGRALQLTNILRDLVEDAARGRCYLPADELARFGCAQGFEPGKNFDRLMGFQVERARGEYAASSTLEKHLHPDGRASSWTLMETYRRLLERIAADPRRVLARRVSLPGRTKLALAARGWWGSGGGVAKGTPV